MGVHLSCPKSYFFSSSLSLKAWSCFVSSLSERVYTALSNPGWPLQNIRLLHYGTTEHANKTILGICIHTP